MSELTISSAAQVDGLEFLAITYPHLYAAALGRPRDTLTSKLVVLGRGTAVAAYNEEAQRSYAHAKSELDGLHMSIENFDLESESEQTFEDEDVASDDERIDTPSSELSLASSVSGEESSKISSDLVWPQREDDQISLTRENSRCRVVTATETLSCVQVSNEPHPDTESTSSPTENHHPLLKGSNDVPAVLFRGIDDSKEQNTSQGEGASVRAPLAIDDSRFVAQATDEFAHPYLGAPQNWLTLTAPSTSAPVTCTEKFTPGAGSQASLTLTPSFIELPSEVSNYSSNIDQSPSLGRDTAGVVNQSPAPDRTSSESLSSSSSSAGDASIAEEDPAAPEVFPDWTVELVRVRLGTESLFTFFSLLDADEKGPATKIALINTFLTLVAAEREKLDLPSPPSSCTATSVLASKILPHTTVLGTTSLATFLAHFDFSEDDAVKAEEIYRVFENLCTEETRKNLLATTGIMGKDRSPSWEAYICLVVTGKSYAPLQHDYN